MCSTVFASHKWMIASPSRLPPPLAILFPSGLNATLTTERVCSVRVFSPVFTSHKRITPLKSPPPPLAILFPSGLNATLQTQIRMPSECL